MFTCLIFILITCVSMFRSESKTADEVESADKVDEVESAGP